MSDDDVPLVISHSEAKARGLKRFFTGEPCKRGHIAERYTSSRGCVECPQEIADEHQKRIAANLLVPLPPEELERLAAFPQAHDDVPLLVARVQVETEQHGKSYEEANWPKLSPMFRRVHNRLRVRRGLSPIPEPKIDLWVPPAMREIRKFDPADKEFVASAREFLGPRMMGGGSEGFEDKGTGSW